VYFSYIVPRFIKESVEAFKDTTLEEIKNILILKEDLIAVGYKPDEVNCIISTFSDGIDVAELNSKQLIKVEERLKEQLSIARQCIENPKRP